MNYNVLYAGLIGFGTGIIMAPWVFYLIRKAGKWLAQLTVRKYE